MGRAHPARNHGRLGRDRGDVAQTQSRSNARGPRRRSLHPSRRRSAAARRWRSPPKEGEERRAPDGWRDEQTNVRYLDPGAKKGKASRGNLWVAGRPDGPVIFDRRLNGAHEHAGTLLRGFAGTLRADGYQAYDALAEKTEGMVRVGCLAHVRRKWFDSLRDHPREARLALKIFARVYRREAACREEKLGPSERTERRGAELTTLFARLRRLARICQRRTLPKSRLGKAAAHTLSRSTSVEALIEHGEAEIGDNPVENAIRPSAIGKKNRLFIGHPEAGGRSAIIYSLLFTCQKFGVDPHTYLRDVPGRLPAMTNQDDLASLMPHQWTPG